MQRSGLWWAYLASFLLNCLLLFLLFTSFKLSLFSKKTPERVYVRLTSQVKPNTRPKNRPIIKPKPKAKNKSKSKSIPKVQSKPKLSSRSKSKPKFKTKTKSQPKAKTKPKSQSKPKTRSKPKAKPKPKVPVITSTEEKFLSEKLKSLAKEKKEKEKELESLRQKIISSYTAAEAKKSTELKKVEQEYRQNAIILIKQILQENFALPVYLKEKEGLFAIVSLDVDVKGNINYRLLKPAPNEEFNQAVEECLKLSSPLPVEGPLHLVVKFKSAGLEAL